MKSRLLSVVVIFKPNSTC